MYPYSWIPSVVHQIISIFGQRIFLTYIFLGKYFGKYLNVFLVDHLSWCVLNPSTILLPYHLSYIWQGKPSSHLNSYEPGNNYSCPATIL